MISPELFRAVVSGERRQLWATAARLGLSLAEVPYSVAMRLRNRRYDRDRSRVTRVNVPVLSVGNLTLGGTGKTPMVTWLARWFRRAGVRVSIVSRGYGQLAGGGNDEALQLEASLPDVPHLQNADRITAAQTAIDELETQLILLDDGFQHRRLHRDLDLVLVDATEPFGYGHVFPRGLLREPLAGLRRADVIAITRANLVKPGVLQSIRQQLTQLAPNAGQLIVDQRVTHLESSGGQRLDTSPVTHQRVLAFCGIGNPAAFQQTLRGMGAELIDFQAFPDHHPYDAETVRRLIDWSAARSEASLVICTHKDLVKLQIDRLGPLPLYAAMLDLEITDGAVAFERQLQTLLHAIPPE